MYKRQVTKRHDLAREKEKEDKMILSSKKMCNRFGAIFLSTVLVFSSCAMTVPVFGAEAGSDAGTVVFDNTGDGEDMISLTEPRSFTAKVKVDLSKDELEKAISDGSVKSVSYTHLTTATRWISGTPCRRST